MSAQLFTINTRHDPTGETRGIEDVFVYDAAKAHIAISGQARAAEPAQIRKALEGAAKSGRLDERTTLLLAFHSRATALITPRGYMNAEDLMNGIGAHRERFSNIILYCCRTGYGVHSIAQDLANKSGLPIQAPDIDIIPQTGLPRALWTPEFIQDDTGHVWLDQTAYIDVNGVTFGEHTYSRALGTKGYATQEGVKRLVSQGEIRMFAPQPLKSTADSQPLPRGGTVTPSLVDGQNPVHG